MSEQSNFSRETVKPQEPMVPWEAPVGSLMKRWQRSCYTLQSAHTDSNNNPFRTAFRSALPFIFSVQAVFVAHKQGHLGRGRERNFCTYEHVLFGLCPHGGEDLSHQKDLSHRFHQNKSSHQSKVAAGLKKPLISGD